MKKTLVKIWIMTMMLGGLFLSPTFAQTPENGFHILPEIEEKEDIEKLNTTIKKISDQPGYVMDEYRNAATSGDLTFEQKRTGGIMNRNTLLEYVAYLIRFLSQLGLVIGAAMIIYAGYQYATNVFWGKEQAGNTAIKDAIIGVLVISFSYAIMKFLTSMFLGT